MPRIVHGFELNRTNDALLLRVEDPSNPDNHMREIWLPFSQVDKVVTMPAVPPSTYKRAVVTITDWLAGRVGLA